MTSRRSPPRRLNGSRRAAIALFATVAVFSQARFARADRTADALKQTLAGAAVDWEAGTIAATGGAAADLRMPSVDLSRPGAQRRAHAAAVAKLRGALTTLPLGSGNKLTTAEIDRAVGRARDVDVQYQSNGGAIVRVEIRFGDWLETPSAPDGFAVAVASMHLSAAPTARVGASSMLAIVWLTACLIASSSARSRAPAALPPTTGACPVTMRAPGVVGTSVGAGAGGGGPGGGAGVCANAEALRNRRAAGRITRFIAAACQRR